MKKAIQALVLLAPGLLFSAGCQASEEKAQALFEQATNRRGEPARCAAEGHS